MRKPKERTEYVKVFYRLSIRDTLIATFPVLLSLLMWMMILVLGLEGLSAEFKYTAFYPLMVLFWIWGMTSKGLKFVHFPRTTWDVEREVLPKSRRKKK